MIKSESAEKYDETLWEELICCYEKIPVMGLLSKKSNLLVYSAPDVYIPENIKYVPAKCTAGQKALLRHLVCNTKKSCVVSLRDVCHLLGQDFIKETCTNLHISGMFLYRADGMSVYCVAPEYDERIGYANRLHVDGEFKVEAVDTRIFNDFVTSTTMADGTIDESGWSYDPPTTVVEPSIHSGSSGGFLSFQYARTTISGSTPEVGGCGYDSIVEDELYSIVMGADGGTIPKRCELVKEKKKTEKLDKATKNATKWKNCQMTQQALKKPIIACRLGRLYNKEAVIEAILTKTIGSSQTASHIKGLKDFKELKLTKNKDFKGEGNEVKGDAYLDHNQTQFLCPVTSIPMNGNHNFVVNWKCGCVFSEKALQEVKSQFCHGCGGPWSAEESIQLNPEDELLEEYKRRLAAEKAEKKGKKEKKEKDEDKDKKKAEKRKAESEIQSDPSKSDTYKKLFTTSKEAMDKPQGHWVTFNPLYY